MVSELQTMVFLGTPDQAELIYEDMAKRGLTEVEQYILRRYLDLDIPESLEGHSFMEDNVYWHTLSSVLDRLPDEAKTQI
jgi:hypothetical protein